MRSTKPHRKRSTVRVDMNYYLYSDLMDNIATISAHTDKYGVMDKTAKQCLKDARNTVYEIEHSEDVKIINYAERYNK